MSLDYESQIENNEKLVEQTKRLVVSLKALTKTVDGKRVLKGILDMCPSQDCFSTDSNTMAYQCGRMAIGLELRNFIKIHCGNDLLSSIENTEI